MSELKEVRRRAAKAALWREKLEESLREAHEAGAPLRAIAEAASLSHEHVRRLISQDQASGS